MRLLFSLLFLFIMPCAFAQTFSASPNQAIADNATTEYPINVSGLAPGIIDTANFGLETVCINLNHTYDADLEIYIVAPDGTVISLTAGQGGGDDNYTNTCFNQNATQFITQVSAPFTGTFKPMGQLGLVNNGQNANGIWKLRITDTYAADAGFLFNWSISFGNNPASFFTITESNLPIFVINTNGQTIPDEPRIGADLGIIWNGDTARNYLNAGFNHYNGRVGIETRGASSSNFPKKSYRIELWDQNNQDVEIPLCGFPIESDWVLSAQYTDKTLMRGMLTFDLIRRMGWWAPRTKPVELILNGEYKGVYLLMEKVKRDNNRIDIAKLDSADISGADVTGGYIIKLDKNSGQSAPGWTSTYSPWPSGSSIDFSYDYPKADEILPQQADYIHAFVDSFENALAGPNFADPINGYRKYVDINSCVDAFIIEEFSRSIDAYRKSFYIYKQKITAGGKLIMAPVWDYDLSYGNVDFCEGQNYTGWQYNFNYICGNDYWLNPFWFERMTQDASFNDLVKCRYNELRLNALKNERIGNWIDSTAQYLNESQDWNFTVWPIIGTYVWPNYYIGQSYQEEVDTLKWWIGNRGTFMQNNLPGNAASCNLVGNMDIQKIEAVTVFPNPFKENFNCTVYTENKTAILITLSDMLGRVVYTEQINSSVGNNLIPINIELPKGIYLLKIDAGKRQWKQKLVSGL